MWDAIRAEHVKLWSTRSTWYTLLGAAVVGVGIPVVVAWYAVRLWDGHPPAIRSHLTVTPLAPFAAWLAALALAVLGVLTMTSEHATGLIGTSLAAVPRRPWLFAAKAIAVGVFALTAGEAIVFTAFLLTRWIVGDRPIPFLTYRFPQEIHVLLSLGLGVMVFALVGLGAGALLRGATPVIVVVVVGCGYALPLIALHPPAPWNDRLAAVLLPKLAGQLSGSPQLTAVAHPLLSPPEALVVMAAYLAAAVGGGVAARTRRDAA